MNLYLILHFYSCTATTLSCHFRNIEVESIYGNLLESLDALGPVKCALTRRLPNGDKIVPYFSQILTNISLNLCNNSDQTLFCSTLMFARSLGKCWKPRFSTFPEGPTKLNVWKTMFDPYIKISNILCALHLHFAEKYEELLHCKSFTNGTVKLKMLWTTGYSMFIPYVHQSVHLIHVCSVDRTREGICIFT